MKKTLTKIIPSLISVLFFIPMVIFAAGLVPCNGPDCTIDSVFQLVNGAIKYFLRIAVSLAAVTFAYAGAKILLNPDKPGARSDALKMIWNTVWGLVIVLCSWLVIYLLIKAIVPNASSALRFLGK